MSFQIRDFNFSDKDYAAMINIHNTVWPDDKTDEKQRRFSDKERNPSYFWQRMMAEENGRIIGYGAYCETWWSKADGKYYIDFITLPEHQRRGIASTFAEVAIGKLKERGEVRLIEASTREDKAEGVDYLIHRGFKQVMRYPISYLEVAKFDTTPYDGLEKKLTQQGIRLCTLQEMSKTDPDWLQKIYNLDKTIEIDIPSPDPLTFPEIDEYKKFLKSPSYLPDAYFIAADTTQENTVVGTSTLVYSEANPDRLFVGLTGTLPSHRRRGIASALKMRTIEFAQKRKGVDFIETDNEENNPMYNLNMKLGFKPMPAFVDFQKKFDE